MAKKVGLFKEPKYKKYAKIVSFKDPKSARISVRDLKQEFDSAKTQTKKLRIFKVTQLAENRARATLKRKNLSVKEKYEFAEIAQIYGKMADRFGKRLKPTSSKYARMKYREWRKYEEM